MTTPTDFAVKTEDSRTCRDSLTPPDNQIHPLAGNVNLLDVSRELVFDSLGSMPETNLSSSSPVTHPTQKCLKRKRPKVLEPPAKWSGKNSSAKNKQKKAKQCKDSKSVSQVANSSQMQQLSVLLPPDTMDLADAACEGMQSNTRTDNRKQSATLQESGRESPPVLLEAAEVAPGAQPQCLQMQSPGADAISPPPPASQQQNATKKARTGTSRKQKSETRKCKNADKPKSKNKKEISRNKLHDKTVMSKSPTKRKKTETVEECPRHDCPSKTSTIQTKWKASSSLLAELEKEIGGQSAKRSKPDPLAELSPSGGDCKVDVLDPLHIATDLPPTLTPQRQLKQSKKFSRSHMHIGPELSPPQLSPVYGMPVTDSGPSLTHELLSKTPSATAPKKRKQKKKANSARCPPSLVLHGALPNTGKALIGQDWQPSSHKPEFAHSCMPAPCNIKPEIVHSCMSGSAVRCNISSGGRKNNAQRKLQHQGMTAEKLVSDTLGISADKNSASSLYTLLKMEPSELKKLTVDGSKVVDVLADLPGASPRCSIKTLPKRNIRLPARFLETKGPEDRLVQPLKATTKVKQLCGRSARPAKQQKLDHGPRSTLLTPHLAKPSSPPKRKQNTKVKAKAVTNVSLPTNPANSPKKKKRPRKEASESLPKLTVPKLELQPLDANHNTSSHVMCRDQEDDLHLTLSPTGSEPVSLSDRLQDLFVSSSTDQNAFMHDIAVQVPDAGSDPEPAFHAIQSQHSSTPQKDGHTTFPNPTVATDLLPLSKSPSMVVALKVPPGEQLARSTTGTQTCDMDLYMVDFENI